MVLSVNGDANKEILWIQWTGGCAAMLALFISGLTRGWSSPYLAQLLAEDSPLPITTDEASWIASLLNLGRLTGAILGFIAVYSFGSRKTLVAAGVPFGLSWVILIMANSVILIYLARFSSGLAIGVIYSGFPLFLGEISSPEIRGSMVSLAMAGVNLGVVAGNLMGAYLSIQIFSYVSLVPTVICASLFLWLPDSPHDLVRVDKIEDAKESIRRYNSMVDIEEELKSVQDFVDTSHSVTFMEKLKECILPQNRRAGLVIFLLFIFMQFSGLNTVIFYMETILTDAKVTVIDPATIVIIVNAIGTACGFVATYTADKFGRKKLLIGSSSGICLTMIGLGVHFTLIDQGFDARNSEWLPIASLVAYQLAFPFGHAIIANVVLSELFPAHIKSIAAGFAGVTTGTFAFIASKGYQPVVDAFGEAWVFWIHGIMMILCIIFVLTLMPETKQKTLQEIQDKLTRKAISRQFSVGA